MRFNPEITQAGSVAKQFRQKNEKPARGGPGGISNLRFEI
jgi:hypothetical protein